MARSAQAHKLKNKLVNESIVLGDYQDLPAFMLSTGKMIRLPDPRSTAYIHEMLTLCIDNAIDAVYALQEQEVKLLTGAGQLFKEYNIDIRLTDNEI